MPIEMKDSGIEWIGEVPKSWNISKLKYELKEPMKYGASESGVEYSDALPRYIRITDITTDNKLKEEGKLSLTDEQARGYLLKGETILFARSGGTVGKSFLYKPEYGKAAFAGYLISGVPNVHKMLPKWLYYFTLSNSYLDWTNRIFTQATIQNIGADKYSNLPIPIPDLRTQETIIIHLDSKCSEIDQLHFDIEKQIEILEEYKKSVITEAVTKGLNPDVEMKDSGIEWIGMIPIDWNVDKGKYFIDYIQRQPRDDDEVITCFRDGEVTLRKNRREEGFTISEKEIGYQGINKGDLIVHGMDGFAGSIGISDSNGKASPVLNVLLPKGNKKYYMYYLRSMAYQNVFLALSTGIRVRTCDTNWNKLRELPYPIPKYKEQDIIANFIDSKCSEIDGTITDKKKQLEILEEYKKSLIYEYVTGKKQVPEQEVK